LPIKKNPSFKIEKRKKKEIYLKEDVTVYIVKIKTT